MDIFNLLTLIGGLSLFLFGMHVMGNALERRAGNGLKLLLERMTKNKYKAFLTGLAVTAVIQSSSATTVMVVGFVNSGIMTLGQSIGVIMGANIGTTVTAWILSLGGISGDNLFVQLLKPTSFTPILALIGIALLMAGKSSKKRDTGTILLGFATLMFGMDTMSGAVSGLSEVPAFRDMFIMFQNPVLGVLVGAVLTAVIQSSSASVGILQALTVTGQVSYAAAIPIVMGQNIGTCVTALLSSFGANRNAKRAAILHLSFNIIGSLFWLVVYGLLTLVWRPVILDAAASYLGIAVTHTVFNLLCMLLLFPASSLLERLAIKLVPDKTGGEAVTELDERLLHTPSLALESCRALVCDMSEEASRSLTASLAYLARPSAQSAELIRRVEGITDHYEDIVGTYLVKLSRYRVSDSDGSRVSMLLKAIGDFERIADHSVNILEAAEELNEKKIELSPSAKKELFTLCDAVSEIVALSHTAFTTNDTEAAMRIEPLEEVIDDIKLHLRDQHILRLKNGDCTVEAGFVWSDLLTNLERIADHCSNIAACVLDASQDNMNVHKLVREIKNSESFDRLYTQYAQKYTLTE